MQPVYRGDYRKPYRDDPAPRRDLLPRDSFLTTSSVIATRGCHNRCGFCYLSTKGLHMPYRLRDVEQVVAELKADGQPYAVFVDNNLGSRPEYLRELCRALTPLEIIWSAALTIDVTDDPTLVREMALAGCTGVFIGFESLNAGNIQDARQALAGARRLRAPRRDPARQRHPGERQLRARLRSRRCERVREDRRMDRAEPPRVRDVPHPHAVSRHAAIRSARQGKARRASRLAPLRHGARRVRAEAHDAAKSSWTATSAATGGCSPIARSGAGARRIGAQCCRISRCRTSTSARTASGIS